MRKHLRGEKGATMLEAAIITPLLLLLTFSIIDFASLFYVYLALENGASQATRYGVTGNTEDDPDTPGTKLLARRLGQDGDAQRPRRRSRWTTAPSSSAISRSAAAPGLPERRWTERNRQGHGHLYVEVPDAGDPASSSPTGRSP